MNRRRLFGWWRFAEDVAASLTNPRTGITTADVEVRIAIRESWLFRCSEAVVAAIERAWRASIVRQSVERVSDTWQAWLPAGRVRAVGVCIAVAMATALLLQTLESSLDGPLRWVLPTVVGVLGVMIALAAEPIARLTGDRRA